MAKLKRCDLCGAEADDLMSIEFPLEERWMLFFRKKSLCHYADVCLDCLEKIRAERQAQIKANEVDFEIADTPQTECRTCKWAEVSWTSHYCDDCKAHNKYEPNNTPQTDCNDCTHWDYVHNVCVHPNGCNYHEREKMITPQTDCG